MNAIPASTRSICPTPEVPAWVLDGVVDEPGRWIEDEDGLEERRLRTESGRILWSVRRRDALSLDSEAFRAAAYRAYCRIARRVADQKRAHPVRIWNFIPAILGPLGKLPHRYMVFNAGRFEAYERWLGNRERFDRKVATATGVGHFGDDLVIHCLTTVEPGVPVENPRQVAAYCYSRRYGPLPPCFARATRVGDRARPLLLVGGTASVLGEDSAHCGDLSAQTRETFANLASVVGAALGEESGQSSDAALLARYRSLRVYYVRGGDVPALRDALQAAFPSSTRIETVQADLCRPELLVEIEGVAGLDHAGLRSLDPDGVA